MIAGENVELAEAETLCDRSTCKHHVIMRYEDKNSPSDRW